MASRPSDRNVRPPPRPDLPDTTAASSCRESGCARPRASFSQLACHIGRHWVPDKDACCCGP